jgi:hypothetical protein
VVQSFTFRNECICVTYFPNITTFPVNCCGSHNIHKLNCISFQEPIWMRIVSKVQMIGGKASEDD